MDEYDNKLLENQKVLDQLAQNLEGETVQIRADTAQLVNMLNRKSNTIRNILDSIKELDLPIHDGFYLEKESQIRISESLNAIQKILSIELEKDDSTILLQDHSTLV
jgi:2,3-bisphosphoglycerate-independent phosphoglycerate mutase